MIAGVKMAVLFSFVIRSTLQSVSPVTTLPSVAISINRINKSIYINELDKIARL
ncbi:hypothetical protein XF_1824 [Xylella fastidiosa 9a5c]|uniref:Uncharacterized protein n=1 Tax=Xylella fastidiosa (strain 9a5c) TaxID=160492 RepID=Q9PCF7_XYLFA|nr:hypothetical protein XF_1824 [Xylella fastidiosa 9a5c]